MRFEYSNSQVLVKVALHRHVFLGKDLQLCTFKRRGCFLYLPLNIDQCLISLAPNYQNSLNLFVPIIYEQVQNLLGCRTICMDREIWIFDKVEDWRF